MFILFGQKRPILSTRPQLLHFGMPLKTSERMRNLPTMKVYQHKGFLNSQTMSLQHPASEVDWTVAICQYQYKSPHSTLLTEQQVIKLITVI